MSIPVIDINFEDYEQKLIEQINLGFELLKQYKETSKNYLEVLNQMINETKIKFENNNSIPEKKEKLYKAKKQIDKLYLDASSGTYKLMNEYTKNKYFANKGLIFQGLPRNDDFRKYLYEEKTRLDKSIKRIIDAENEFIRYKRQQRIEKLRILESIDLLMAQLETLDKKRFRELLKRINNIDYQTEEKVYRLKHILGHLRAGKISNSVNNKALRYFNISALLKKEKNMVQGVKEMRKKIREEQKKEKEERIEKAKAAKAEKIKKLSEEIENIKQSIIKIYKKTFVGMNVPEDINKSINKLKKQTLSDKDKKIFDKKVKRYNLIISKLKALKKSS